MHAKLPCQMPPVQKGKASSLLQLINHVSSHMTALQALSLNVPIQDSMLNHLLPLKMDTETQREWELIMTSRTDTPNTAELVTFLETMSRILEVLQTTQSLKSAVFTPRSSQSTGRKVSKPTYTNVATQLQCPVCNSSHRHFKRDRFITMQPKQSLNSAKQLKLCSSFMQLFTKEHTCSKQMYRQCHKRHYTLLHIDKKNQQQMTTGSPQTITILQMQRAQQLQRSTLTVH